MAKAEAKIPWVTSREVVARVARHLSCTPEDAELRIDGKAKAGLIRARGVTEGRPVSPLPAAWHGATDLAGTTMRPPGASCEITNLELCFIDLVATGLLPAPAERAWWSAEEAIAYLVKGVPLPWKEWMGAGATASEIEQAGKELARIIGEDRVPARGRRGNLQGPMEQIPGSDLRIRGVTWVVRPDGDLGTSPPGRLAVFQGRRWYGIEVDSATVRQAFPKPLQVARRMLDDAEQPYAEGGSEPAARAEESMPEPAPAVEPEPAPPSSQVEPEPPVEPARRGPPEQYDWDEGFQFMRRELDKRGDPANQINAVEGWRSDADVARLVAAHIAIGDQQPDPKHTARTIRPKLKEWRAEQAERNGA